MLLVFCAPGQLLSLAGQEQRLFALRWLREKEVERERQEHQMRSYVRWTFWAAAAAVVAGIVGVLVTWFAR